MVAKLDVKKNLRDFYFPSKSGFHLVDVPSMNFLMVDGSGNPNISPEYQRAVELLYSLSYGIKFALKSEGYEHIVPPLEGLWWMPNMDEFTVENKHRWKWTMMIMQPEWVTEEWVEKVKANLEKKKKLTKGDKVRFETYPEGLSVQILYTGAYTDEAPTIAEMHRFIHQNGFMENGKHHEIYLGDPRKTAPDKLKTILRQPIHIK